MWPPVHANFVFFKVRTFHLLSIYALKDQLRVYSLDTVKYVYRVTIYIVLFYP